MIGPMSEQSPPGGPYGAYPQTPGAVPSPPPPTHGKATTSLILGILSIVLCGLVTGIPAIVLGRQARREIRDSNGALGGDGLAQAGFVTGIIGTVWTGLVTLFVLGVFVLGSVVSTSFEETCSTVDANGATVDCS
jgi:hypothetical protein